MGKYIHRVEGKAKVRVKIRARGLWLEPAVSRSMRARWSAVYIRYVEIEKPKPEETKVGILPHYYSRDWPGLNVGTWAGYKRDIDNVSCREVEPDGITPKPDGITVLPGVEFGRDEGHFLSYGLASFGELQERYGQNTISHVALLGGFGYIAHPTVPDIGWDLEGVDWGTCFGRCHLDRRCCDAWNITHLEGTSYAPFL